MNTHEKNETLIKNVFQKIDMSEFLISPKGQILKNTEENRAQLLKQKEWNERKYENRCKCRNCPLAGE